MTRLLPLVATLLLLGCSTEGATPESPIALEWVEVVTHQAAVGDFNNGWGGHQSRITRASGGHLYTVYTVMEASDQSPNARAFRLARRDGNTWSIIGGAPVYGEPVHVVRGPDDTVRMIAMVDNGRFAMWTLEPGSEDLVRSEIPGAWHDGDPAYSAVGINPQGDVYLLASVGGGQPGGQLQWARYAAESQTWGPFNEIETDYRYAYAYLFPAAAGKLGVVANRDVLWSVLSNDSTNPDNYAFNSIGYWQASEPASGDPVGVIVRMEPATDEYPEPDAFNNYLGDAFVDMAGRTHVVYQLRGESTGGDEQLWHAVLDDGRVIHDARLGTDHGWGGVMTQDSEGTLYLLAYRFGGGSRSSLDVYAALDDLGAEWANPVKIPFGEHEIRYSGITLAAPRTGTQNADYVDGAFPAGDSSDNEWVAFRLTLR
jgi:hypothetical protein